MRVHLGSGRLACLAAGAVARCGWDTWAFPEKHPASVEQDGEVFEVIGVGASRAALLGPDGVVYKASWSEGDMQFDSESGLFYTLELYGLDWCPDYCPYDEHRVMAMRRYHPCASAEAAAKVTVTSLYGDVASGNWGQADDGRLVLLDGGSASLPDGYTPAWAQA